MPDAAPYLLAAQSLLDRPAATGYRGWWPRAVAWLLRIQLEQDLSAYLQARGLPADLSGRSSLLMLHRYLDAEQVQNVASAWHGLSRAGHHHAYELAPTQAELRSWAQAVAGSPLRGG